MHRMLIPVFILFTFCLSAQPTVGVLSKSEEALEGYTFFSPFSGTKAYLVDNCGNLINEWDRGTRPGLAAYFLDNGLMLRTYKINPNGPFTSASNAGGIELVNWANETVWNYEINTTEQLSHHDAVMMPNGHVLILTWELTYGDELIELGRDPDEIAVENYMWSEKILELEPVGSNDANIIWEWHINDHYIQDFDETKVGFGVVSEHPELFDINQPDLNSGNSNETRDWNHFNAIDYNPTLDQILVSVRNSDEIWILDHSTTTEEAASHEGGTYGKGGDILYRWGNASAYQAAPIQDQLLWGQHGVHWVKDGLDNEGQILIYDNGNGKPGEDYSQIQLLVPPQDQDGFYTLNENEPFGPLETNTIYGDIQSERFFSAYLSNAQQLSNGNLLINAGSPGRIFEVTPERDIAWEYEIPLFGDFPATQGQNVNDNANFRAYKYDKDFKGFDGLDVTPGLPIELDPEECDLMSDVEKVITHSYQVKYLANDQSIFISGDMNKVKSVSIYNMHGKLIKNIDRIDNWISLENKWPAGVYPVQLVFVDGMTFTQKLFITQ